jgi:hypothetical protein
MKKLYKLVPVLLLFLGCSKGDKTSATPGSGVGAGVGGSLARFAVASNHLYTVNPTHLNAYDVSTAENPVHQKAMNLGFGIETVFPYKDNLFIGTQDGMKIMDISLPDNPVLISDYSHIRSCDPVVANDQYAFVTLRTDVACTRGVNELQVIDISDLKKPKRLKSYPMSQPRGLALDGDQLFVCDGGIKHYDASDPLNLVLKEKVIIEATDVIAYNGILMVVGRDGIYQYDYTKGMLDYLSKLPSK